MSTSNQDFSQLKAVFINCSIKYDKNGSHTQHLINRAAQVMEKEGVSVKHIYALDHEIPFGMVEDASDDNRQDDWPQIQAEIMAADILVIGSPIWLGVKSSVATLVIERLYAYSGQQNDKGQYLYYGKAGGCLITGNEDGVKHCAMDILYALQHIGYTIPPQADAGWIGEVGPGPSYGDTEYNGKKLDSPAGYDSEFTNRNTTFMAWNLMHTAKLLKDNNGIPAVGNVAEDWKSVTNASDANPEYH
ncbi:flavodoxin family protein [Candidatus Pacebacteria bacterium]|nr:flavodoxin family protein [Candidatus Paceibacterota bacterium]